MVVDQFVWSKSSSYTNKIHGPRFLQTMFTVLPDIRRLLAMPMCITRIPICLQDIQSISNNNGVLPFSCRVYRTRAAELQRIFLLFRGIQDILGDLKVCTNNYRHKEKNRGVHFDLGSREIRFWTPLIAGTIHNPLSLSIC